MKNVKEIREIWDNLNGIISFRQFVKKYFDKDSSLYFHKLQQSVINNVKYGFTEKEIQILINALKCESDNMLKVAESLSEIKKKMQRERGFFPTKQNPFNHPLFEEWFSQFINGKQKILEPFYGNGAIPIFLKQLGITNEWVCYDKEKSFDIVSHHVIKRDVIKNFPSGFRVAITNPPYLAKVSAKRRSLYYPDTKYADLYMVCLEKMLENCKYVAAIIPESFITQNLFTERLYGVISLNVKMFEETECPVCLALFSPEKECDCPQIYIGNEYVGDLCDLAKYNFEEYYSLNYEWVFNDKSGILGVKCVDNNSGDDIKFFEGEKIHPDKIKVSSRSYTRISGLPENIDLEKFIATCNKNLQEYRQNTKDVFMTSFKGLRKDGKYRRRIDFKTLKCIMNKSLQDLEICHQKICHQRKGT